MTTALRIAIADDEPKWSGELQELLTELGHQVIASVSNGQELVDVTVREKPDVVITDVMMPTKGGIEAAIEISEQYATPVILVSRRQTDELIRLAVSDHVMAWLSKPVRKSELAVAIPLGLQRFRDLYALQKRADRLEERANDLERTLEERKIVERAKGILMQNLELSEPDAFAKLQQLASEQHIRMPELARKIVEARNFD